MSPGVPPLAFFCIHVLSRVPDQLHHVHHHRIPASPALLDALAHAREPCLWAALAQLVHPLPPDLHDHDLPLSHPALPILQKIQDSPDFTLVTLVALPNCTHLRDDDIASLRSLHRLLALDLRGCAISSCALTALARGLVAPSTDGPTRSGTWGLRLLSLYGCPNIDDHVLPALTKFPLLSAIDLRFTRCTSTAVSARLTPPGFLPSDNNTLFHPASLSLALYSLEKIALTVSDPISLYSCPPQSVFRVHIDKLDHDRFRAKKTIPVASSSTPHSVIRTISSAEDTLVFIPPLRKQTKHNSTPPSKPSVPCALVSATPTSSTSSQVDQPVRASLGSNVSSFYEDAPAHFRKSILPLSAQAVQPSEGDRLDPLAIARSPPPWSILDSYKSHTITNPLVTLSCRRTASDNMENSRWTQPNARWIGQALNNPLQVDRARLHKRGSDAVVDMTRQFTCKRPKIESEFALEKTRARASVKSRNPFARTVRSVFAESNTGTPDEPQSLVHESQLEVKPDMQLRASRSLPIKTVEQQGPNAKGTPNKPLKPITSLKPPILPKELLPSMPRHSSKHRADLKQIRLSFSRDLE